MCQGHTDELWGLASHPSRPVFLTCAQDRLVCLWNSVDHSLQWSRPLEVRLGVGRSGGAHWYSGDWQVIDRWLTALSVPQEHGHCADFHPSGAVVAIGTHSGKSVYIIYRSMTPPNSHPVYIQIYTDLQIINRFKHGDIWQSNWSPGLRWYVLDAETTDLVGIHTDGNEQLSVMRFSVGGLCFKTVSKMTQWEKWTTCPRMPPSLCLTQMVVYWLLDLMTTSFTSTPSQTKDASTADMGNARWVLVHYFYLFYFLISGCVHVPRPNLNPTLGQLVPIKTQVLAFPGVSVLVTVHLFYDTAEHHHITAVHFNMTAARWDVKTP